MRKVSTAVLAALAAALLVLGTVSGAPVAAGPGAARQADASADLIRTFDYDRISTNRSVVGTGRLWHREQEPTIKGVLQTDRIRVVTTAPGTGTYRPSGNTLRFETRPGNMTNTGGYLASRSEVLGRQANPTSTPNSKWPDPEGSTRWYGFPLYLDPSWKFATDNKWLLLTQWKGLGLGSPAIDLSIHKDKLRIGGTGGTTDIATAKKGTWTYVQIGILFSAAAGTGWVEAWIDGRQVLAPTPRRTMNVTATGTTDPSYLKQGIYRASTWQSTHILHFGDTKIGTTRAATAP